MISFVIQISREAYFCKMERSKKKKVMQRFKSEYTKKQPEIREVKTDQHAAFCTVCSKTISIAHGGFHDIKIHIQGANHCSLKKMQQNQSTSMTSFVSKFSTSSTLGSIRAECQMTLFIVEHNLAISVADHLSELVKVMFPKEAKEFQCGRTKATNIIKEMRVECKTDLLDELKRCTYFSISTDGSADSGNKRQLYPVLIRYYNKTYGVVMTDVYSLPANPESSTGENIFKLMDSEIKKNGLTWSNCISFCSDNAAVMMGHKSGVASFIKKENNNAFINGCTCHLAAIAAQNASKKLPVSLEDLLIDILYHMKFSSKRTKELN